MPDIQRSTQQLQPHQRKAHCNACHRETNHQALYGEEAKWSEELAPNSHIYGADTVWLLKCLGCGTIHMIMEDWFSEARGYDDEVIVNSKHYPAMISRRRPDWFNSFGMWNRRNIFGLLREIYVALDNDQQRLAAMGVRALLEHIMLDKVGDRGSFAANVTAFVDEGHLATNDRPDFEKALLELGHATMHRNFLPNKEDLAVAMDMTENLIARLYVHPDAAKTVAERIPPRQPRRS